MTPLPESVQQIADVIGRRRALLLIGQLPKRRAGVVGKAGDRVAFYFPKNSNSKAHLLVRILGEVDAERLQKHFGGEHVQLANCREIITAWRNREIVRLRASGLRADAVAEIMGLSRRCIDMVFRKTRT